jgi:hypothetical protein
VICDCEIEKARGDEGEREGKSERDKARGKEVKRGGESELEREGRVKEGDRREMIREAAYSSWLLQCHSATPSLVFSYCSSSPLLASH